MKNDEKLPSNRSFGALFVIVFGLLAIWQGWRGAHEWSMLWFSFASMTLLITIIWPQYLTPFNRAWMSLGHFLGRIVSPVVLGIMYMILIVPVGLFMKLIGRDVLHRKYCKCASYWQLREDGIIKSDNFRNQF